MDRVNVGVKTNERTRDNSGFYNKISIDFVCLQSGHSPFVEDEAYTHVCNKRSEGVVNDRNEEKE